MAPHVSRDQFGARGNHGIAECIMRWIKEAWRRIRSLVRQYSIESGLDEEIGFHIDQQTEKNVRAGMTRRFVSLEDAMRDLRYGMRALRRAPGFTAVSSL